MSKLKMTCRLLLFASVLLLPIPALALPQFSIAGDGTYVLKGTQFQGVTGVQVYISYDSGLTNPRVDLGGLMKGLLSAENHSGNPIVINGVTTSVINGSGTIATITFDKTGNGVGSVNVWGFVIGPTGQKLTMAAPSVSNPIPPIASTDPSADNGGGGNNGNGGSNGGGGNNGNPGGNGNTDNGGGYRQPFVAGGTLTFPPADAGGKDTTKETAKDTAAPATEPEPQQSAAA